MIKSICTTVYEASDGSRHASAAEARQREKVVILRNELARIKDEFGLSSFITEDDIEVFAAELANSPLLLIVPTTKREAK